MTATGQVLASSIASLKGIGIQDMAISLRGVGEDLVPLSKGICEGFSIISSARVNIRGSAQEIIKSLTPLKGTTNISAFISLHAKSSV
jgi:hypothetical protein